MGDLNDYPSNKSVQLIMEKLTLKSPLHPINLKEHITIGGEWNILDHICISKGWNEGSCLPMKRMEPFLHWNIYFPLTREILFPLEHFGGAKYLGGY